MTYPNRADKAEVKLETAIIEGVRIATTVPVEQVPDAIKAKLAELTGRGDNSQPTRFDEYGHYGENNPPVGSNK